MESGGAATVTFHDPCYLGRQNGEYEAPRDLLSGAGAELVEMDRIKQNSFCCGGGGAQAWKEEEAGTQAVNSARFEEASTTKADTVAVGCPYCLKMLSDAGAKDGSKMEVKDVAEIVAKAIAG